MKTLCMILILFVSLFARAENPIMSIGEVNSIVSERVNEETLMCIIYISGSQKFTLNDPEGLFNKEEGLRYGIEIICDGEIILDGFFAYEDFNNLGNYRINSVTAFAKHMYLNGLSVKSCDPPSAQCVFAR